MNEREALKQRVERLERELRNASFPGAPHPEVRENDDGTINVVGYAAVFDVWYEVFDFLGPYDERVAPGAFTKTLREKADVRFLVNHEGLPLARTKSGTLLLEQDDIGLRYEAPDLDPKDPDVLRVVPKLRRKDVAESSFAFRTLRQEWDEDYLKRTLIELELFDVSVVTWPANPATSVGLRALDVIKTIAQTDPEELLVQARAAGGLSREEVEAAHRTLAQLLEAGRLGEAPDDAQRDTPSKIPTAMAQRAAEVLSLQAR